MIERGGDEWQRRMDALHERLDEQIAELGHTFMGVGGSEETLPFCYTIGLQKLDLPELLLVGSYDLQNVLHYYAERMKTEGAYPDGLPIRSEYAKIPLVAVHCDNPDAWDEYTYQNVVHFETRDYRIIQLVVADKEGRYPWESGCADPYAMQPILGKTPTYSGRPQ